MALDLKFEQFVSFEPIGNLSVSHEESLETAIPEYCPDMARIVETIGQLRVREKNLQEDHLSITGSIKVTVLYTSEESNGLRSLVVSVPFTCNVDDKVLTGCQSVCVDGRLLLVEAKAVTNRKLYVHVVPEFIISGSRPRNHQICTDTESEEKLQIRRESVSANLLTYNTEKAFDFTEEIELTDGNEPLDDILYDQIWWQIESCKRISSKIVIKGQAVLSVLYRTEQQKLATFDVQMPFSQILDGGDPPENGNFYASLHCMESDVHLLRSESCCRFSVTAKVLANICAWESKTFNYIADLYSTREELEVENQVIDLQSEQIMSSAVQEATQQLEFGHDDPFVYVTSVDCGGVTITSENGRGVMRSMAQVKILYLDETGTPVSTERSIEVSAENADMPDHAQAHTGMPKWKMSGQSAQLQIPITFMPTKRVSYSIYPVSQVETQGSLERDMIPSLVLRRMGENETLWDLGKQYRTDPEMIMRTNHLEGENVDQMLLIPKTR